MRCWAEAEAAVVADAVAAVMENTVVAAEGKVVKAMDPQATRACAVYLEVTSLTVVPGTWQT
mgnify:CR=1 FL=1